MAPAPPEKSGEEDSDGPYVNKAMAVDPPAAHVCRRCGHVEKVEQIMLISRERDTCEECGARDLRIDSWERAQE